MRRTVLLFLLLAIIISGCASPKIAPPDNSIIAFLQKGITTKEEVLLTLGYPSGQYDDERILTYRLIYCADDGWRVMERCVPFKWDFVKYSLVLVFDDNEVLDKHSLVNIR